MSYHSGGLISSTCVLLSITLMLSQTILADTDSTKLVTKSHTGQGNKPQLLSLDLTLEIEEDSSLSADVSEPQSELQKLLSHEQESHIHVGGKVMLNDNASIEHPSLHDIDGGEIDLTVDFE